ncbi:thiolase family protein [Nakamurella sp. PAMC28650]|uniref:thiolase family protein n=1 Tax=Nakamurella sp. PAMC28650 TaxID=2762325 RepID=UPI00164DC1A7|nr:thiolase family protein [Nakamurella sp. PAMC28650]
MSTPGHVPVIVTSRRTAVGTAGHAFSKLGTTDLAAPLLAEAFASCAALGLPVDDVILGNCMGAGGDVARVAALAAGLGVDVPAVTVDRQCGSGLDAVLQAASRVRAGDAELVLAGGVESASTAVWRTRPPSDGTPAVRYTRAPFAPEGFADPDMGCAAEDLALRLGISRARQDDYAARSHALAAASVASGVFAAEILPVAGIFADERPRTGLTVHRLGRLRPAFRPGGTVTAGNSSGVSDGAAVVSVTTAALAHRAGMSGTRILGAAVTGGDPALPGLAIATSVRKLLAGRGIADHGIAVRDIGAVEITEAFAAVALAAIDGLALDAEVVCSDGGAIGMGHPWAASGAILLVRLIARMSRPGGSRLGLAACAIGGGQGIAMLLERDPASGAG